ncbi:hypothetical protein SLA2020_125460 [Shorea laevis]
MDLFIGERVEEHDGDITLSHQQPTVFGEPDLGISQIRAELAVGGVGERVEEIADRGIASKKHKKRKLKDLRWYFFRFPRREPFELRRN